MLSPSALNPRNLGDPPEHNRSTSLPRQQATPRAHRVKINNHSAKCP